MRLQSLLSQLRKFAARPASEPLSLATVGTDTQRATTLPLDRPLTEEERKIAEWLLENAGQTSRAFMAQLDHVRVIGRCGCGCPTVDLRVADGTPPAPPQDNPIGDAIGYVNGKMVGVMMLQAPAISHASKSTI